MNCRYNKCNQIGYGNSDGYCFYHYQATRGKIINYLTPQDQSMVLEAWNLKKLPHWIGTRVIFYAEEEITIGIYERIKHEELVLPDKTRGK